MTFQYLTVSCIPAIRYVPNDKIHTGNLFWTVADILWHIYLVRYLTLIVVMVLYLGKIPIVFPDRIFLVAN